MDDDKVPSRKTEPKQACCCGSRPLWILLLIAICALIIFT